MSLKSLTKKNLPMLLILCALTSFAAAVPDDQAVTKTVNIPDSDQFIPFAVTIHVGDSVRWVNNDTDDHTIVAVSKFTTTDHKTVNHVILGTDNNSGQPGVFQLKFNVEGRFVYRCRFHSMLNVNKQPIAPGPRGGIQNSNGNFGTPMMGEITVAHD